MDLESRRRLGSLFDHRDAKAFEYLKSFGQCLMAARSLYLPRWHPLGIPIVWCGMELHGCGLPN